jgi:hypothetical protein
MTEHRLLATLASLIGIMQSHVMSHVDAIISIVLDAWSWSPNLRQLVIEVIDALALALGGTFRRYLPDLLPLILQAFKREWPFDEEDRAALLRTRVLRCLIQLGPVLDDHLHLVLGPVLETIEGADMPVHVRRTALRTCEALAYQVDVTPHATRIVHVLVRVLVDGPTDLRKNALDVLHAILINIGSAFEPFVEIVEEVREPCSSA